MSETYYCQACLLYSQRLVEMEYKAKPGLHVCPNCRDSFRMTKKIASDIIQDVLALYKRMEEKLKELPLANPFKPGSLGEKKAELKSEEKHNVP